MGLPSIFIVGPNVSLASPIPELATLHRTRTAECTAVVTRSTRLCEGAVVNILQPRDAERIYRQAHAAECCIIYMPDVHVALDPRSVTRPRQKQIRSIYSFLRYKACCVPASSKDWRNRFSEWCQQPGRHDGMKDPRCLVFHIFSADVGVPALDTADERELFDHSYVRGGFCCDRAEYQWGLSPTAFHAGPPLKLCGVDLPPGMHWDVECGASGTSTLTTITEVWRVPTGSYLNIAPNGHVRCATARSRATRTFPGPKNR